MTSCGDLRILFRAPAGPRRGYGHLVRCRSLARALGVRPLVALRGGPRVIETAVALGCDVVQGSATRLLRSLAPDVLVVDDPVAADARRWIAAARRVGCLVVSIHDLGLGCLDADLVIDGSMTRERPRPSGPHARRSTVRAARSVNQSIEEERARSVLGPRRSWRRPACRARARHRRSDRRRRIPTRRCESPAASEGIPRRLVGTITWIGPARSLHQEMARASVAVVGGGVSLYEACALGTPAIGVPVVAAQRPTVAAFVARGAARGVASGPVSAESVAAECVSLLSDAAMRRHTSRMGRRLIDGRGAFRAAAAVGEWLAAGGSR